MGFKTKELSPALLNPILIPKQWSISTGFCQCIVVGSFCVSLCVRVGGGGGACV